MALEFATASIKEAKIIVVGVPLDRSSSFMPGCRFGPNQIRIATQNIETYSPYFNKDISNLKIYDAGDLSLTFSSIQQTFRQIQNAVSTHIQNNKKVVCLGGEHTITFPIISEFIKKYPNLNTIQLDAHPDTRDELYGEKFCHATVIKRISEIIPSKNIFQLGLRSVTGPIQNKNQYLFNVVKHLDKIIKQIGTKPCYLTLDIDVIDCGMMPAVQTPIPNGITFHELFVSIRKMSKLNIVGCDIVEYNPMASSNMAYACSVAEVLRELLFIVNA